MTGLQESDDTPPGKARQSIAILSQDPTLYSTRRLKESAMELGHDVRVVDYLRCTMTVQAGNPEVFYQGRPLTGLDAIIPRIGNGNTIYGTAVVRHFELAGVKSLNNAQAILTARDKLRCLQILSREGVGIPITGYAHSPLDHSRIIESVGGAPLVIKLLEGTHGIGVVLAETKTAAQSVIEAFRGLDANIMVQEFIKEAAGEDIRCFVAGDRVVAAMKRKSKGADFRANMHRGATSELAILTPGEIRTALLATKALGLDVAGVDMLRSTRGPLVIEVNASPGLEGIEKATGVDVASVMVSTLAEIK